LSMSGGALQAGDMVVGMLGSDRGFQVHADVEWFKNTSVAGLTPPTRGRQARGRGPSAPPAASRHAPCAVPEAVRRKRPQQVPPGAEAGSRGSR
jgi:hypothetical protein